MADRFDVGDIIKMKKPHPCGSQDQIMVPRKLVEKNTRQITKKA